MPELKIMNETPGSKKENNEGFLRLSELQTNFSWRCRTLWEFSGEIYPLFLLDQIWSRARPRSIILYKTRVSTCVCAGKDNLFKLDFFSVNLFN